MGLVAFGRQSYEVGILICLFGFDPFLFLLVWNRGWCWYWGFYFLSTVWICHDLCHVLFLCSFLFLTHDLSLCQGWVFERRLRCCLTLSCPVLGRQVGSVDTFESSGGYTA